MSETPKRSTRGKRRLFGDKDDDKDGPPQSIASSSFAARERLVTTTIAETPQKKTKKTSNHESFFSPKKGKPFVTPDKLEDVDDDDDVVEVGSPPWKKTRLSDQFSPVKATKKAEDSPYIPTYIHKNLTYKRQGDASLPDKVVKTYQLVCQHYEIPDDFETNRSYGPLSGISYEERAISAYSLGLLDHKPGDEGIEICSNCVTVGHKRNDCPQLI